jgi:hypothetical protein
MSKTLILVHGRGFKPPRAALDALWYRALRAGIVRDAAAAIPAFEQCRREFVYFGDETRAMLIAAGRRDDGPLDLADLENTLTELRALARSKDFRREHYERLPGKTPIKEFLADIGAPTLAALHLEERVIGRFLPELIDYWRHAASPIRAVDARLRETVGAALARGDDVAIVSHCIGAVFAYNALWALSRDSAVAADRKVSLWMTLGAPLGDEGVKRRLDDAGVEAAHRYPRNVVAWINVAAEDDYVSHDDRIADDYRAMLDRRLISRIEDVRIYNLAVRYGRSNPHNALGYLIHPRVSRAIATWLGVPPIAP